MTLGQERKIGEMVVRQIRAAGAYLEDPEVNDYLNELGHRLVAAIPEGRQEFEFFAVADPSINAFALPGGYIGVNTGLILLAQTESELAAVLAHEITHVTQRHMARAMAKEKNAMLYMLAGLAVAIAASRAGGSSSSQATSGRARLGAGARDPDADQLHPRERIRSRSHRLPAPRSRRLRRQRDGDADGPAAEREPVRRRQRAVLSAQPPDHPRARRRSAVARPRQGVPAGHRLARLPPRPRAAAKLLGHAEGGRRVLRRRDRRAQVQQRGRGALRPRRVAAAERGISAGQRGARHAREDRAAASDDRGDGRRTC